MTTQYFCITLKNTYGAATFALGGKTGSAWVTQYNTPNIAYFAKITHLLGLTILVAHNIGTMETREFMALGCIIYAHSPQTYPTIFEEHNTAG